VVPSFTYVLTVGEISVGSTLTADLVPAYVAIGHSSVTLPNVVEAEVVYARADVLDPRYVETFTDDGWGYLF